VFEVLYRRGRNTYERRLVQNAGNYVKFGIYKWGWANAVNPYPNARVVYHDELADTRTFGPCFVGRLLELLRGPAAMDLPIPFPNT
jgi:hypothetical protein